MLNENIRSIRKAKGLSQEELAIQLHVVRQTISKWEKGLSVPDADMLIALSAALETSVSALLGETLTEPEPDDFQALAEKLEAINLQFARGKAARRKALHWTCIALCAAIVLVCVPGRAPQPLPGVGLRRPRNDGRRRGDARIGVAVRPSGAGRPRRGRHWGLPDAKEGMIPPGRTSPSA